MHTVNKIQETVWEKSLSAVHALVVCVSGPSSFGTDRSKPLILVAERGGMSGTQSSRKRSTTKEFYAYIGTYCAVSHTTVLDFSLGILTLEQAMIQIRSLWIWLQTHLAFNWDSNNIWQSIWAQKLSLSSWCQFVQLIDLIDLCTVYICIIALKSFSLVSPFWQTLKSTNCLASTVMKMHHHISN